jgi:hypothetical protein
MIHPAGVHGVAPKKAFARVPGVQFGKASGFQESITTKYSILPFVTRKKKYSDIGKMKCSKFENKSTVFLGTII